MFPSRWQSLLPLCPTWNAIFSFNIKCGKPHRSLFGCDHVQEGCIKQALTHDFKDLLDEALEAVLAFLVSLMTGRLHLSHGLLEPLLQQVHIVVDILFVLPSQPIFCKLGPFPLDCLWFQTSSRLIASSAAPFSSFCYSSTASANFLLAILRVWGRAVVAGRRWRLGYPQLICGRSSHPWHHHCISQLVCRVLWCTASCLSLDLVASVELCSIKDYDTAHFEETLEFFEDSVILVYTPFIQLRNKLFDCVWLVRSSTVPSRQGGDRCLQADWSSHSGTWSGTQANHL